MPQGRVEGFNELLDLVEKTPYIGIEHLAREIEDLERLLIETWDEQDEFPLAIDLTGLIEDIQGAAREQVDYILDMAQAGALEIVDAGKKSVELRDRLVLGTHTVVS